MTKTHHPPGQDMVKGRLLSAALELFTSRGYSATTVREIVAAAGVTKPVLYYYFGSKEGIYLALMQETYATFAKQTILLTAHTGTLRERIIHFCTGVLDEFVAQIDVVRLIYAMYFGPPQGAPPFPYEEPFDWMLETIGGLVREGIATGELNEVSEADATWALIAALNTVMEEQLCHTPPRMNRDGLTRILNLIISGIAQGARK